MSENNNFIDSLEDIDDEMEYLNTPQVENEFNDKFLNYALHYARLGYPVFPVHSVNGINGCSCNRGIDCDKKGKHPRNKNGLKGATTDENIIIDWWDKKYPYSNIGLRTGRESGIFVLDIDPKAGGEYSLEELEDSYRQIARGKNLEYEPLPATLTTITGSGGRHLYFKYDLDLKIKSSASKIGSGLDIRADGGYIVAPPSIHSSGNSYKWFGINTPIEDAPRWLLYEILKQQKPKQFKENQSKNTSGSALTRKKIRDGEGRNDAFVRHVSGLVRSHSLSRCLELARDYNAQVLVPPYPDEKVVAQVNDLFKRYSGKPSTFKNQRNLESEIPLKE